MKKQPDGASSGRKLFVRCCFAAALLSPVVWIYFIRLIGNPFALDSFSTGDLLLCLGGTALPVIFSLLIWSVQGKLGGYKSGWLFAACCFVFGALCWGFTLGSNWHAWEAAAEQGRITTAQSGRLTLCCLWGLTCALIPLIPAVVAALREQKKD